MRVREPPTTGLRVGVPQGIFLVAVHGPPGATSQAFWTLISMRVQPFESALPLSDWRPESWGVGAGAEALAGSLVTRHAGPGL